MIQRQEPHVIVYRARNGIAWRSEGMPYSECETIINGSKKLLTKHHIMAYIVPYSVGKNIRMMGELENEDW